MTTKVRIIIHVDPSREVPQGIYKNVCLPISDGQWQNMLSAVTELEVELRHYAPDSSTSSKKKEEDE